MIITIYNIEKSYLTVVRSGDQETPPLGRPPKEEFGGRPWLVALHGQLCQARSSCHIFSNIFIVSREFIRFDRRVSPPNLFHVIFHSQHGGDKKRERQKRDKTYLIIIILFILM